MSTITIHAEDCRPSFMKCAGILSHEAADELRSAQADFSRIDEEMWQADSHQLHLDCGDGARTGVGILLVRRSLLECRHAAVREALSDFVAEHESRGRGKSRFARLNPPKRQRDGNFADARFTRCRFAVFTLTGFAATSDTKARLRRDTNLHENATGLGAAAFCEGHEANRTVCSCNSIALDARVTKHVVFSCQFVKPKAFRVPSPCREPKVEMTRCLIAKVAPTAWQ